MNRICPPTHLLDHINLFATAFQLLDPRTHAVSRAAGEKFPSFSGVSPGHLRSSSLIHRPTLCCRFRVLLVRTGLHCLTGCTEQHNLPRRYVPLCSTLQRILARTRALGAPSCSDLLELCKLRSRHGPVHAAVTQLTTCPRLPCV